MTDTRLGREGVVIVRWVIDTRLEKSWESGGRGRALTWGGSENQKGYGY